MSIRNYLFQFGPLIGEPFEVTEKNKKRHNDVYFNYAKTHQFFFAITIPKGYKPAGYSKLNKKIDNSAMLYEVKTSIKNKQLIISHTLAYKTNFVKKEKWNEVLEVLTAVQNLYESKIMFKKK